jgi:hypothetical protein
VPRYWVCVKACGLTVHPHVGSPRAGWLSWTMTWLSESRPHACFGATESVPQDAAWLTWYTLGLQAPFFLPLHFLPWGALSRTHTRSFTMHGLIMFSPLPLPTQTSKCLRGIRNIHFTASSSVSFVVLVVQVSITGEYFSLVHLFNYTITTYYHTLSGRIRQ